MNGSEEVKGGVGTLALAGHLHQLISDIIPTLRLYDAMCIGFWTSHTSQLTGQHLSYHLGLNSIQLFSKENYFD